jgi:hypothetical protein
VIKQASGLSYVVRVGILGKYFGQFCFVIGALTLVSLGASLLFDEPHINIKYLVVIVTLGGLGAVLSRIGASGQAQDNEAMVPTAWLSLKIAKHHASFLLYKEARENLFIFSPT